jgi:hypothetical protein
MEMLYPGQANTHLIFSINKDIYSYNVDNLSDISGDGMFTFPVDIDQYSVYYDHTYVAANGPSSACHLFSIKQTTGALVEDDNLNLSTYTSGISRIQATEGQYVVVVTWDWDNPEVIFINKNDPASLTYEGKAPIEYSTSDIADVSSGDYCIFAFGRDGWSIHDTSSPALEFQYQFDAINVPIDSVIVPAGNVALALNQSNNKYQQIYTLDMSNPNKIAIADMIQFENNWIYRIAHNDHVAATSNASDNIMIIDFSDPFNMEIVYNLTPAHDVQSQPMFIYKDTLYAILYDGDYVLQTWNITNPSLPYTTGSAPTGSDVLSYAVDGDYLYAYDSGNNELLIYDVSAPMYPSSVGSIPLTADAIYNMKVVNHVLYMSHGTGLLTFSLADNENPVQIDEDIIFSSDSETSLDANSANAFMHTSGDHAPVFLSLSTPENPVNVQAFDYPYGGSYDISASDAWLCFMSVSYGPRFYQLK